jgi:hypothetical protein
MDFNPLCLQHVFELDFHAFHSTAAILQDILLFSLAHAGDVLWRTTGMAGRIALNRSRTS